MVDEHESVSELVHSKQEKVWLAQIYVEEDPVPAPVMVDIDLDIVVRFIHAGGTYSKLDCDHLLVHYVLLRLSHGLLRRF